MKLNNAAVGSKLGMLRRSGRLIWANRAHTCWEQKVPTALIPDTVLQVGAMCGAYVQNNNPSACDKVT